MHTYNNFTAQNVKQMYMYSKEIKICIYKKMYIGLGNENVHFYIF